MPFFKFNRQRKLSQKSKSSSMGSIYKDYGQEHPSNSSTWDPIDPGRTSYRERKISEDVESNREIRNLQEQNLKLQEEKNVLQLKVEILLDMLAQKTAEAELQEGDLLKMRNILANS
ncbi:hypothetical protein TCAL_01434 [Tigriopus californicus]|uniref:Uncharacterized protein n=1 Tax=Tigriopus californicus TaxID=6832 RepID=A0A553NUK4_TIGCA|nr:protein chibby homolog 1-like [Tigriopus californicus]TRY69100.1 hypothetical protein TCAL_01434 [Tigriopus californicus]|eukprot:TCALIF_01434-PA protein Name:"Similar to Cby1 Protein chibby homolog 1 (Rattus norvegicus)" AED:0.05 eAED:0.05 QI:59/1/0.5/1/1/1/2/0/116